MRRVALGAGGAASRLSSVPLAMRVESGAATLSAGADSEREGRGDASPAIAIASPTPRACRDHHAECILFGRLRLAGGRLHAQQRGKIAA
jgi:hypothetical protein